ncbi:MAG: alpha/beta fold hydrolase [Cytophagales bacterium]
MNLHFKELGSGQPLVILHGLFGSSDNWFTIGKQFAEHFHVYIVDQRNHGLSPHTDLHNYELMASDVYEFLLQNTIENPVLIGHSMGGKTVIKFLTTYQINIKKAIVVDISPRYYPLHHQAYLKAMTSLELSTLQSRQALENALIENGIENIGERQFLMKNLARDENGQFYWKINLETLVNEIENIGEGTASNAHSDVPILFVKGANSDFYIKPEDATLIHQIFPNSKIIAIENAGHWVQAEQPAAFLEIVLDFVND